MSKYMFKCPTCSTVISIQTDLDSKHIHMAPPCPCGKSRMDYMQSEAYKYGTRTGLWE